MDLAALRDKIREYAAIPRVSGYEGEAAKAFAEDLRPFCDTVKTDRIGNVIGTVEGTDPSSPSLMIFAHMDTIGFIIRYLDPNGFIKAERMGGVPEKLVQGTPVRVGSEDGRWYDGVIGARSYHTMNDADKAKADPLSSLSIDV
jgi:putative aminopeptidase FrvX